MDNANSRVASLLKTKDEHNKKLPLSMLPDTPFP